MVLKVIKMINLFPITQTCSIMAEMGLARVVICFYCPLGPIIQSLSK